MEHIKQKVNRLNLLAKWPTVCGLLGLLLVQAAPATVPLYENDSVVNVTIPPDIFPTIDATNFVNNNSFTINFTAFTINTELFQTWNTINYTNNDLMVSDNGFRFDTQTTNVIPEQMAGTFYNPGEIDCASTNDTNVFIELNAGQFIVWATNIVNPGTVDVGDGGLLQFTGQNVNLTRGVFTMETFDPFLGFFNPGLVPVDYGVGIDTNQDWNPGFALTPTTAASSEFSSQSVPLFNEMVLTNSSSYFYIVHPSSNYTIVRAIFINNNPGINVSNNIYFGGDIIGAGAAHVEWVGTYIDPASGLPADNYLYLSDFYLGGGNTNNPIFNGVPSNFTYAEGGQEFFGPPALTNFPPDIFTNVGVVTNTYSYTSVTFTPTTVATNSPSQNVTNYLAILPGRMQISASQELNLGLAEIDGPNYLSIGAHNQFDGSSGAQIFSPYSDIDIGVTNGFLTVSNLLEPALPRWSGAVQAWTSDWIFVDTNGVTNDFRVLLVNSSISPTTPSQVQDLLLHGTNSIVVSDTFNVLRTFSADSTNLTLTTNGLGAGSVDGELNLESSGIFWAASTPNLRCLTNNGGIRLQNLAVFGTAPANYLALINNGLISDQGAQVWANIFVNSGQFANGISSFTLQSLTATMTNGSVTAGGDVAITTGSLVTSNLTMVAGKSLTITATNLLTDTGVTNGNIWTVGSSSIGNGLSLPIKPPVGDLLGTTITNIGPDNKNVVNTWAGLDYGVSTAGYTNNEAIGRLILDSQATAAHPVPHTEFTFNGTGVSNAIYVDYLELRDAATNHDGSGNVPSLVFNPNLVIYYAQAVRNGISVAQQLNHKNGDHLRWVAAYAGYFSSTNIIYTNIVNGMTNITTNTVNAALAQSTSLDSDCDGTPNGGGDPTPFFVSGEVNFTQTLTNLPPPSVRLQWATIPLATNYLFFKTNLLSPNWSLLPTNPALPANPFVSPQPYNPNPGPDNYEITNIITFDALTNGPQRFYRVRVDPNLLQLYGP